ncbi:flagellar motor switch protein FliN [Zhongshania aliphaticivorans]|uniref:flagellar motor switch protein FliN n=1 Tax=Zhongshania aliphaticivorans TaxID=1470434 RepID=UPI0039C91171
MTDDVNNQESVATATNRKEAVSAAEIKELNEHTSGQQTKPAASPSGSGRMSNDMSLDMIMDVSVNVAVEVGRTKMSIRDLRELSQGAIIELDRAAGTPLDVLVNDTLVARGEIVVVKDKFGIMLTEVVGQEERERRG